MFFLLAMSHKITDFLLDSKRVGTRLILTEFGFRLRAAFVILSDALTESNCEAAPKAESKRLYAQNDRFIFFQSYSVTETYFKIYLIVISVLLLSIFAAYWER